MDAGESALVEAARQAVPGADPHVLAEAVEEVFAVEGDSALRLVEAVEPEVRRAFQVFDPGERERVVSEVLEFTRLRLGAIEDGLLERALERAAAIGEARAAAGREAPRVRRDGLPIGLPAVPGVP